MLELDLGKIRMNWKGAYDALVQYAKNDSVSFQGGSYVALQPVTGESPLEAPTKWDAIARGFIINDSTPEDYQTLTYRSGEAIYKPQGVIQLQYDYVGGGDFDFNTPLGNGRGYIVRTNNVGNWTPFTQVWSPETAFNPSATWNTTPINPLTAVITPKFSDSIIKYECNVAVSLGVVNDHFQVRIMRSSDSGVTWERPPQLDNYWNEAVSANPSPNAEDGAYVHTTNGAVYAYQLLPVRISFIDFGLTAGTEYRYRLEFKKHDNATSRFHANYNPTYTGTQNYSRATTSWVMATEINNGD